MSLLDGRHTVQVELATATRDAYNSVKVSYDRPAVSVRCNVHPLRADEATALGVQVDTALSVTARRWPGGPYTRVTWQGRQWFQRGEVQASRTGRATQHDRAVLVAQTGQVK